MLSKLQKAGVCLAAVFVFLLLTAAIATWALRRQEVGSISDEQKMAGTLEIFRASTPTNHKVLKVLFYGQSITSSGWHNAVSNRQIQAMRALC
jgi:hypothetical protein